MIPDNETNFIYFSDLLRTDPIYSKACERITAALDSFNISYAFLQKTNDIWARDYMPIQISADKFIEYRYDPDYLQEKPYSESKTDPGMVGDSINLKTVKTNIILDGGNVVKSKNCIILTDKIVHENRFLCNENELIKRLKETFEVDKVIVIHWFKQEIFGHADGVLRFINDTTVLVHEEWKSTKKLIESLKNNCLDIEWLKFSGMKKDKLNWAYINFLQTEDLILIPKLNIEEDQQAFEQICTHYASYAAKGRIAQVEMTDIVKQGGALNCCTWTIKNA